MTGNSNTRWSVLAHLVVGAKTNGREHAEKVFSNYLQQAYEAGLEEAAKISTRHAMKMGPTKNFTMGGHKIAEKILKRKDILR